MNRIVLAAVSTVLLTAIAGCAPTGPSNEPTPSVSDSTSSAQPTEAPEVLVDTIVIRAEGFDLVADGDVVAELSANDIDGTVAGLTELLGDPAFELVAAGECNPEFEKYEWADVMRLDAGNSVLGDYRARVFAAVATATDSRDIAIQGPGGEQVGDDISAVIAATDPTLVETFLTSDIVLLEVGWLTSGFVAGVAAFADSGVVQNFGMPIPVNSGLDC